MLTLGDEIKCSGAKLAKQKPQRLSELGTNVREEIRKDGAPVLVLNER